MTRTWPAALVPLGLLALFAAAFLILRPLDRLTQNVPPIETMFVEVPSRLGAHGSKGVGEPPAIPGPAAIANAIRDATGVRVTQLPMKAEVILSALGGERAMAAD